MSYTQLKIGEKIVQLLRDSGFIAFFAGGWVRDFIMDMPSDDIDIATNAHPEQVVNIFEKSIAVGSKFGVVRVIVEDYEFEIATFRSDAQYVDGRRPTGVQLLSSPEQDAQRRDFTINGMFYDPIKQMLYDYVGGQKDISNRLIRTIGNPLKRFSEDRLRIIRAIRFKNKFDFSIDTATWNAMCQESSHVITSVSPERIWQELQKMVKNKTLARCLSDLYHCSLLSLLFPLAHSSKEEIFQCIANIQQYTGSSLAAALSLLIRCNREALVKRYHLSNKEKSVFSTFSYIESLPQNPSELEYVSLYSLPESNTCIAAYACTKEDPNQYIEQHIRRKKSLNFWVQQLQSHSFVLSAKELCQFVKPGKEMGRLIKRAFELSLYNKIKDKQTILSFLKKELS